MADSATSRRCTTAGRSGGPGRRAEAAEPTGSGRQSRSPSGSGTTRHTPAKTAAAASGSAKTPKPAGKTSAATTAKPAAKAAAKPTTKPATATAKPAGKPAAKPTSARPAAKPATRSTPAKPAPNTAGWTAKELAEVQSDLRQQYDVLRAEYDQAMAALDDLQRVSSDNAGDDQADTGSKTFEREQEMSLAHNRLDLLTQIERALGRIDDGSYGLCEACGNPIAKPRLQAFPSATLCVECKQKQERR